MPEPYPSNLIKWFAASDYGEGEKYWESELNYPSRSYIIEKLNLLTSDKNILLKICTFVFTSGGRSQKIV